VEAFEVTEIVRVKFTPSTALNQGGNVRGLFAHPAQASAPGGNGEECTCLMSRSANPASRITIRRILTRPPTGAPAGGAPVSDPAVPAHDRAMLPDRRPALRGQCPDAPISSHPPSLTFATEWPVATLAPAQTRPS